jgi:hypothetical protein
LEFDDHHPHRLPFGKGSIKAGGVPKRGFRKRGGKTIMMVVMMMMMVMM